MNKGILYVQLMERTVKGDCKGEKQSNGDLTTGLKVLEKSTRLLMESLDHKAGVEG